MSIGDGRGGGRRSQQTAAPGADLASFVAVFAVTWGDGCVSADELQRVLVVQLTGQMTEGKYVGFYCRAQNEPMSDGGWVFVACSYLLPGSAPMASSKLGARWIN